ncbi:MAG TPA: dihydroxy-acid dehydratase, partial [Gaiellaceae bacterium]
MPTMRNGGYEGADGRRSSEWFDRRDLDGFLHRSWLKSTGVDDDAFRGRPVIGICNTWSELVNCNIHLRGLAEAVKRGVLQAGGFPREFPVMSLGESLMKPTTMLYRNLMAMDVEESIRSYPLDGVVLLTGCDKTNPAAILGAASADIPSIVVTGGPMLNGHWRGEELGSCSDCWHYNEELRAGRITEDEFREIENAMSRSNGHCMTMGTASTMACVTEALGLTLPGGAAIPAVDSRRAQLAEAAGRQIVALADQGLRPSDILTRDAFENAIRALHAISGSTNAIIHLIAYAGRVGVDLPLGLFDELCASTPWLVDLKPAGAHLMEDFFYAGGLPAVLDQIRDLLHLDAVTVTGRTLGENLDSAPTSIVDEGVIRPRSNPLDEGGSLVVLRGNLCPDGAVMKISAADPRLLSHEGRAIVFEDIHDLAARADDPDLDVDADSVMVLRNAGPVGAPGMPEWGHLPIPAKLLKQGVTD